MKIVLSGPTEHDGLRIDHAGTLPDKFFMPVRGLPTMMGSNDPTMVHEWGKVQSYVKYRLNEDGDIVYRYEGVQNV